MRSGSFTAGCELDPHSFDPTTGRHEEPWPDCHFLYGYSGAATTIEGAVLAGSLSGKLSAFDVESGDVTWTFNTRRSFDTLNGIPGQGGSLDNAAYAIGSGHLVVQSGYCLRYRQWPPGGAERLQLH